MMTNKRYGTLYVGWTSDLPKRVHEHKSDIVEGFTKQHQLHRLVYYQPIEDYDSALEQEKRMKRWRRAWKINVIEKQNPTWEDLFDDLE